jgi:hypothetical protein
MVCIASNWSRATPNVWYSGSELTNRGQNTSCQPIRSKNSRRTPTSGSEGKIKCLKKTFAFDDSLLAEAVCHWWACPLKKMVRMKRMGTLNRIGGMSPAKVLRYRSLWQL